MRLVRVGAGSISVKVGDFAGNAQRLRDVIGAAREQGVHLLATPELGICGYSLEDRIWWPHVARQSWETLCELAGYCDGIGVFVGLPVHLDSLMYNAAAFVHDGQVRGLILKRYLPTYSIFYEGRNWAPWVRGATTYHGVPAGDLVFQLPYGRVSAEICEDLWSARSPAYERVAAGAEVICNGSASPFAPLKNRQRRNMVKVAAQHLACVYVYANLLGCDNSRLVFDGGGFIATPEGIVAEGPHLSKAPWTLASGVVDLDQVDRVRAENSTWRQGVIAQAGREGPKEVEVAGSPFRPAPIADYVRQMPRSFFDAGASETGLRDQYLEELFHGLVLGLRDYFEKVGAFERFLVALSGGRDSALCLLLAVHAAQAVKEGRDAARYTERVSAAYMPNPPYSSAATERAARSLAEELGVPFRVVSIAAEAEAAFAKAAEMAGGPEKVTPIARQNLQARIRGSMMLNWANNAKGLVLVTSNLSEAAVGYTTTGGDNQGGYSPIANVPKTVISRLLEYLMRRDGLRSLQAILAIPPSAELAPEQLDEADLMPYAVLDDLLYLFARLRMPLAECWKILCHRHPAHAPEQLRSWTAAFGDRFIHSQWKRDQHPVSMKVMELDLDPKTGFRFPVMQSIQHELDALAAAPLDG